MSARNTRVVFDCNVYAQALINEVSPAGRCYALARSGDMILFVSAYVLEEIVELHLKLPARYGVTLDDCHALLNEIQTFARSSSLRPSASFTRWIQTTHPM